MDICIYACETNRHRYILPVIHTCLLLFYPLMKPETVCITKSFQPKYKSINIIRNLRKNLKLNIKPLEAVIRVMLAFALTFLIALFQSTLAIVIICGVVTYLLITALMFFCPVKSLLQHGIGGKRNITKEEKEMPFKDL